MYDRQRKGRPAEISTEAAAWVINFVCQRPSDLGYSRELWTLAKLHKHIQDHAAEAGVVRLTTV